MKKFILLLAISMACFAGCREDRRAVMRSEDDRIHVTTTIFAPYDFVRNIAGDRVNLTMLLPPGSESHSFEPSPRDIITIQNTDVFIYIGGESDEWVARILESMDTDTMKILTLMDMVERLEEEIVEGMEDHDHDDHDDDHDHEIVFDEHVWTSPRNAMAIIQAITEILCEADSVNADFYRNNAAAYIEALQELDAAFEAVIAGAQRRTVVFGDRFPFRYFAHAYGLEYFAAFPGCSTQTEPSVATVAFLINKIREEQIPVIFHIELSNERMADTISGETGAQKLLLHSAHNITRRDFDAGLGFLEIMHRNVDNLREALY
ncbi:MAG: metal ABC transporter substrate-binding protein [Treponema sp.]|nr:metal ABC transporter substrate-binding protein [Treponema sp.]